MFHHHYVYRPLAVAAAALDAAALSIAAIIAEKSLVRGFVVTTTVQVGGINERNHFSLHRWKTLVGAVYVYVAGRTFASCAKISKLYVNRHSHGSCLYSCSWAYWVNFS